MTIVETNTMIIKFGFRNFEPSILKLNFLILVLLFTTLSPIFCQSIDSPFVKKKIILGGDAGYPPSTFFENGKPVGFQVDVIKAVAKSVQLEVEVQFTPWNEALKKLSSGEIDVVAMSYSNERGELFDFSVQFAINSFGLLVNKDSDIKRITDTAGKRILVQKGGVMRNYLKNNRLDAKITYLTDAENIITKLAKGDYDGAFLSKKTAYYIVKKLRIASLKFIGKEISLKQTVFGVKKGNIKLVQLLNEGLSIVYANGEMEIINEKWFGSPSNVFIDIALVKKWALRIGTSILIILGLSLVWSWRLKSEIKERKRTENALRESEEKYKHIATNINELICELDAYGIFTYVNDQYKEFLGFDSIDLIGERFIDYVHQDDLAKLSNKNQPFSLLEHNTTNTWRLRHKDGTYDHFESRHAFYVDKQEKYNFVVVSHNITVRIRTEEELKKHGILLEEKVAERTKELSAAYYLAKKAREQAEVASKSKSEFLANMSHEFRSPLHHILSFAQFGIKNTISTNETKLNKYFNKIINSGNQLLLLINDLMDLSKLEAGKMEFSHEIYKIDQLIDETVLETEKTLKNQNQTVKILNDNVSEKITCDGIRIKQVIHNLLSNAIKFSNEKSQTIIKLNTVNEKSSKYTQPHIKISISDDGIGIPEDEIDLIFDKFAQSSQTNTGAGGKGLGLAICKEIINAHNGKIWAENNPDGGATFSFMLPYEQDVVC